MTQGFRIRVDRVEDDEVREALEQARRRLRRETGRMLAAAAEKTVLPEAQRRAPKSHGISASLVVRARALGAYLTTSKRGKIGRLAGLLEYGGTVRTHILPTRQRRRRQGRRPAVMTPQGPRYAVRAPRTYAGKLYLTTAVSERFRDFTDEVQDKHLEAFAAAGLEVRK